MGRTRRNSARNTREVTAAFIASGIDPKKHIVFNQSQVQETRGADLDLQLRGAGSAGSAA